MSETSLLYLVCGVVAVVAILSGRDVYFRRNEDGMEASVKPAGGRRGGK